MSFFSRITPLLVALVWHLASAPSQAGKKVLYLGDSMSLGDYGRTLDARLRDAEFEVYTVVTGGATPYYWLSDYEPISCDIGHWTKTPKSDKRVKVIRSVPKVEDLIKKYKPDIVIVQTGSNLYSTLRSKHGTEEQNMHTVENLCEKMCTAITDAKCKLYWITPPDAHVQCFPRDLQETMRKIMKETCGEFGTVYDSYAVTKFKDPYPETDGMHYGPEEAIHWANETAEDFIATTFDSENHKKPATPADGEGKSAAAKKEIVRRAKLVEDGSTALDVELELVEKSEFKVPAQIKYRNAFAIYEYKVKQVFSGHYTKPTIRLAQMVVMDRKIMSCRDWKVGKRIILEVVPLSNYPTLERTVEMIDELPMDLAQTIYIPKM